MKRVVVMFIIAVMLFGCGSASKTTKATSDNKKQLSATVEVAYDGQKYTLQEKQTKELLALLDGCPYDSDQYHEENNPDGYRLTLSTSDYHITVYKGEVIYRTIDVWKQAIHAKIGDSYYYVDDIQQELLTFLETHTTK